MLRAAPLPLPSTLRRAAHAGAAAVAALLLPAGGSGAQVARPLGVAADGAVQATVGWEHTFVADARVLAPFGGGGAGGWRGRAVTLGLTMPWVLATTGDAWTLALGLEGVRLRRGGPHGALLRARTTLAHARDATGRWHGVGLELGAAPGWHRARSTVALDLEGRLALATHVRPTPLVRALFDDRPGVAGEARGAEGGWRLGGASHLRAGVAGARLVGGRTVLVGRGGVTYAPDRLGVVANPMLGQLPFHLTLGVARP